jgi:hypothetical protein
MKTRPFGCTGMQVSEIGLGVWQLANPDWGANDASEALQIVHQSLDSGWLAGKYNRKVNFNDVRSRWSPEVVKSIHAFWKRI